MTATPSGTGASPSQRTNRSSTTLPCLTSRIDALPERLDAEPLDSIDEQLVRPIAQLEIGGGDVLHHVGDIAIRYGRADQRAELRLLVAAAADRHLVDLLAVLLDAENADMADMVMAAGVDAAGNVDVQPAQIARDVEIAEAARKLLRHRDGAGIGKAAIVEPRTGDDVGHEIDVGQRHADGVEGAPQLDQVALAHVREHEILLVADTDLAKAVAVGEIGDGLHLLRRGVAGRAPLRFQRQRHDGIAPHLVPIDAGVEPGGESAVGQARRRKRVGIVVERLVGGIAEGRGDLGNHAGLERERTVADGVPLGLHLLGEFLHADLVDEYLDARLVDVVAAAVLVVHAQDRLDIAQEVALGQERLDGLRQVGNAAEPAADADLEAGLALGIAIEPQADVVDFYGGAIVRGGRDGDLELARQEREFRVQR